MPKFLNTIYQTTQSAPATPAAGGSLYASGSGIFFKNSTGTEYNLTSSKGYVILREYTSSGTWTKPSNAKYIKMAAVGAGGGGGGGARNISGRWGGGGAGGAGAATSIVFYTGSLIPGGTYTVTISAGTNGGLGASLSGNFGSTGPTGGNTTLISASVTYIIAAGGAGGGGGSINSGSAGNAFGGASTVGSDPFRRGPFRITGIGGGNNASGVARTPTYVQNSVVTDYHARNGFVCCGGGGAGGTVTAAAANNGASGSGIYLINGTLYTSGAPGRGGVSPNSGDNGVSNIVSVISLLSFSGSATVTSSYGFGTAGHGGGSGDLAGTIAGGAGGHAGGFGCGASGGGGAINQNGGKGGSGSGGYLAILEFY